MNCIHDSGARLQAGPKRLSVVHPPVCRDIQETEVRHRGSWVGYSWLEQWTACDWLKLSCCDWLRFHSVFKGGFLSWVFSLFLSEVCLHAAQTETLVGRLPRSKFLGLAHEGCPESARECSLGLLRAVFASD